MFSGRGNSKCQTPETEAYLVCLSNSAEATVSEPEQQHAVKEEVRD